MAEMADTVRQDEAQARRAAAQSSVRSPPGQIAGYVIERCLGDGAFGSVWLASEKNTGKRVAIKFYNRKPGRDWSLLHREVGKLAEVYTSREIIGLLEVGWEADPPYYVMEYLPNGSLAGLLETGPLPVREAERILTGVAHALVHAHARGILHCDVKPANILLDSTNSPRLADFGQSRLSHEQSPSLGTLFYMAPEQADLQASPSPKWDVYALGAMMYHMVCGQPPHRALEFEQKLLAAKTLEERLCIYRAGIRQGARPAAHRAVPGVDADLIEIIDRALAANPEERLADPQAVLDALAERTRRRVRRPLVVLGLYGPILILLGLIPIVAFAMAGAGRTAERNLAARIIDSDLATAKILAIAVEHGLEERQSQYVEIAADDELRQAVDDATGKSREAPERQALSELIVRTKEASDAELVQMKKTPDDSWFVTDARGVQLARAPFSNESVDHVYAWRDYFHGRGDDYPPDAIPDDIAPIRRPHVSRAFRSQTTDEYRITISVPVWSRDRKQVIGVMGRSLLLGRLLGEYQGLLRGENPLKARRSIALIDLRTGLILDHPWLTAERLARIPKSRLDELRISEPLRVRLEQLGQAVADGTSPGELDRDLRFHDPIAELDAEARQLYGMEWLAAFWPVQRAHWVALVQERRDEALLPVREIQNGLTRYALVGLSVGVAVVASLWMVVVRGSSRRLGEGTTKG